MAFIKELTMRKQPQRRLILFVQACVILYMTSSCGIYGSEKVVSSKNEYYAINPDTIISDLLQSKMDVFTLQDKSPFEASPTLSKPVRWSENDYFRIAQALHKLAWGESLDTWNLSNMNFGLDCNYYDNGPQDARFTYFKTVKVNDQESRDVSEIIIEPRRASVTVHKSEYYPTSVQWQTIDLKQLKISSLEDVLQIAEINGGISARTAVENACSISLTLAPNSVSYDGWNISYTGDDRKYIFEIQINQFTGEYMIVYPKNK
jgi:hypothetical protein